MKEPAWHRRHVFVVKNAYILPPLILPAKRFYFALYNYIVTATLPRKCIININMCCANKVSESSQ